MKHLKIYEDLRTYEKITYEPKEGDYIVYYSDLAQLYYIFQIGQKINIKRLDLKSFYTAELNGTIIQKHTTEYYMDPINTIKNYTIYVSDNLEDCLDHLNTILTANKYNL